jgi:hypothetical protein
LLAEALGPLFEAPQSPDATGALVASLAGVGVILALVALVRGRVARGLGATALILIPGFTYLLGDVYLMEASKKVEFCGSCHETMGPVLRAVRNDGDTLSAMHYQRGAVSHQEACYQCHSGYGLYGTANAKLAGIKHMLVTVTKSYTFPLEHYGKFDLKSCLNCHATAKPFRAVESHRDPDIQKQLLAGEISCAGLCHPDAHPASALMGADAQ